MELVVHWDLMQIVERHIIKETHKLFISLTNEVMTLKSNINEINKKLDELSPKSQKE